MITTRGRYALRMMVDLAVHQDEGFVSLKEISKRQGISRKYLEQIIPILKLNGINKEVLNFIMFDINDTDTSYYNKAMKIQTLINNILKFLRGKIIAGSYCFTKVEKRKNI